PRTSGVGTPMRNLLRLEPMRPTPSPPDVGLALVEERIRLDAGLRPSKMRGDQAVFPFWLTSDGQPAVLVADAREVRRVDARGLILPFPSGAKAIPPGIDSVLAVDWNNEDPVGLLLVGAGGLRFHRQGKKGFEDVTEKTNLPDAIVRGDHHGAW